MRMTEEEYRHHRKSYNGYCSVCDDITRFGDTEPDACRYPCFDCGNSTVRGMEEALSEEFIEFIELEEQ